jgi:hypothetical protein
MTVPGFTAEASLSRTVVTYQRNMVIGGSDAVGILPMQGFTAAPISSQNLTWPPWTKRLWCCAGDMHGIPHCTYFYVPAWYDCYVVYTPLPCWICRPPVSFPLEAAT